MMASVPVAQVGCAICNYFPHFFSQMWTMTASVPVARVECAICGLQWNSYGLLSFCGQLN